MAEGAVVTPEVLADALFLSDVEFFQPITDDISKVNAEAATR